VIGVEPVDADAMYRSLKAGRRVKLDQVGLFADGVAVKQVGVETFRLCRELVDEVLLVDTDAICAAIKDVFEDTRTILEPAGALAIAGAKAWVERKARAAKRWWQWLPAPHELRPAAVCRRGSGIGRAARGSARGYDPERPGSFRQFCALLGPRNITEFNYRYADPQAAHVFVGIQIRNRAETQRLVRALRRHGLKTVDLSDNELAKLHVRHTVAATRRRHQRNTLPLRVSGAPRRADQVPEQHEPRLEHLAVPLPQPRCRLRARAGRHAGAAADKPVFKAFLAKLAIEFGRNPQPRVPAVPRLESES